MTLDTAFLIARCRSSANAPYSNEDPQHTDPEIAAWLQEGLVDYIAKIPADAVPELVTESTFTGSSWTIATDFLKLLSVKLTHITSGTESEITTAFVLPIDAGYVAEQYDGGLGAWAQFRQGIIKVGPNAVSGTVTYQKRPVTLATGCPTFPLGDHHADAIINYATGRMLDKLNDVDAERYMQSYNSKVQAEQQKFGMALDVEKQD